MKPSPAQLKVLENLYHGRKVDAHICSATARGGFYGTIMAMVARGWIHSAVNDLTPEGRRVYEAHVRSGEGSGHTSGAV